MVKDDDNMDCGMDFVAIINFEQRHFNKFETNNGILLTTMTENDDVRQRNSYFKWKPVSLKLFLTHKFSMFIALHCFMIEKQEFIRKKHFLLH